MSNLRKTVFISDLHLQVTDTQNTSLFISLLRRCEKSNIDAIYILGDLFEAWIGDDNHSTYNKTLIAEMNQVTQRGLPIYFIHGNRDFLVGNRFFDESGCHPISDETVINLYGTPTLLMHGDTLCTSDHAYMRTRKWMRKYWLQKLFLCLPLSWRQSIANRMRSASSQHMKTLSNQMMDVSQDTVELKMSQHHVNTLIHGHTHRPNIHTFSINNQPAARVVLSAWHGKSSAYVVDSAGSKQLVPIEDLV